MYIKIKALEQYQSQLKRTDWIEAVKRIRPLEVQIYTVGRTPKEEGVFPVEEEKLKVISYKLKMKTLIPSKVYF